MIIKFSDAFERITSHGWLAQDEGWLLWDCVSRCGGNVAEFGTYQGRSAMLLLQLLVPRGRSLHCVDPWDDEFNTEVLGRTSFERLTQNIDGLAQVPGMEEVWDHVTLSQCKVEDWKPCPCGFVYCDGDHTAEGTKAQVLKAVQCSPQMIAVHDYSNSAGGRLVAGAAVSLLGDPTWLTGTMAVWDRRG